MRDSSQQELDARVRAAGEEWAKGQRNGRGTLMAHDRMILEAGWANVQVESLALAGAWAWARRGTAHGEAPAILADSSTIWYILSNLNRHRVARHLWHESRNDYY